MQSTLSSLQNAHAEIATALTMWVEGQNASEVIQVALNAKIELENALKNLQSHCDD